MANLKLARTPIPIGTQIKKRRQGFSSESCTA